MLRALLLALLLAPPAAAEVLVAARTIRAQAVLTAADLRLVEGAVPGALSDPGVVIGLEARTMIYEGRPIRPEDIGPPTMVERNALVVLIFNRAGLTITAEGRALGRGAPGDRIRIMNLASRTTVTGTVAADGRIIVSPIPGS